MSAKSLPGSENTAADHRNWVIKESIGNTSNAHIIILAALEVYDQYDMAIVLPWCGIVDNVPSAIGQPYTMYVEEGIQIDTDEIESGSVFDTQGQEVWYDPVTKLYSDTEDEGLYLVGYVIIPVNAAGVFRFEKRRYVVEGEAS
jgi:hypothetical protein